METLTYKSIAIQTFVDSILEIHDQRVKGLISEESADEKTQEQIDRLMNATAPARELISDAANANYLLWTRGFLSSDFYLRLYSEFN